MSREILIVWAGRHRRDTWEELCAEYRRRIGRHAAVRDVPVKARGRPGDEHARLAAEAEAIRAALPDPCRTVALDVRGRTSSSEKLAASLERRRESWPHPIAFLVGSDLGLDASLAAAADERLSLSPMTFGHELARLVLYEQLYRALCIAQGIKYHRQPF